MFEFPWGLVIYYNPFNQEYELGWMCKPCGFLLPIQAEECMECGRSRPEKVTFVAQMAKLHPIPAPIISSLN